MVFTESAQNAHGKPSHRPLSLGRPIAQHDNLPPDRAKQCARHPEAVRGQLGQQPIANSRNHGSTSRNRPARGQGSRANRNSSQRGAGKDAKSGRSRRSMSYKITTDYSKPLTRRTPPDDPSTAPPVTYVCPPLAQANPSAQCGSAS